MAIDHIQQHLSAIAADIGPRPALSEAVIDTQNHISDALQRLGLTVEKRPFYSSPSRLQRWGLAAFLTVLGFGLSSQKTRWLRPIGLWALGLAGWSSRQARVGELSAWEQFLPQLPATNLLATLPAQGEIQQQVIFVAHIDTERTADPLRQWLPDACTIIERLPLLGMSLPLTDQASRLRRLLAGVALLQLGRLGIENTNPSTIGANDNASSIALLLALAQHLSQNPLTHTAVHLLFTESDTIGGRGLASFVQDELDNWKDAHWVVLDSIGAGEICWLEPKPIRPEREIEAHLHRIAQEQRHWALMGRSLDIPDPSEALQRLHLNALALVGYQREGDQPVHWRSREDTTEHIEPDSLTKAWEIVLALLKKIEGASA